MEYPDIFLKGIPNDDFLDEMGLPASNIFLFQNRENHPPRTDDNIEESIFWKDDDNAVVIILNQKKNDKIQFQSGAAIFLKEEIDKIIKKPQYKKFLSYERDELEDNPYHGNLLLKKQIKKQVKKKLLAHIASTCEEIINNNLVSN